MFCGLRAASWKQSWSCMCALSPLWNDTFPNIISLLHSAALEPAVKKPVMHYSVSSFFMRTCRSRRARRDQRHMFFFFAFFWGGVWSSKSSSWLNNLQAVPKFIWRAASILSTHWSKIGCGCGKYSFCSFSGDVQKHFQYFFGKKLKWPLSYVCIDERIHAPCAI